MAFFSKKKVWNLAIFVTIIALVITLDQILKAVFIDSHFEVLGDFLWISSITNDGAAFGLFAGARWLFVGLSFPILGVIIWIVLCEKVSNHKFFIITLGLLFSGIVGNLIDRIFLGYVRDFFWFKFWPNFGIFNIADIALVTGCAMLIFYILFDNIIFKKKSIQPQE